MATKSIGIHQMLRNERLASNAAAAQLLASLLYGVSALDPPTFGGIAALVLAVAAAASLIPARRTTRVDPVVSLRCE